MKTHYLKVFALAAMVVMIGTFSACKKDNPTPVVPTDPTPVLTFAAGPYTVAVGAANATIFAATSSIPTGGAITYAITPTTVATINATTGAVTAVSAGTATVTATQAALSGKNVSASATYSLTVTGLTITSFDPAFGGVGYSVKIIGTNFDPIAANNIVTIGGVATATPTGVTATTLTVLVPKGASGPGDIVVKVGTQTATKGTFTEYATVTTLAGDGTQGSTDATGTAAQFWSPTGLAFDLNGNLLVADYGNNRIRSIVTSSGVVTTIAGSGDFDYSDGQGTTAQMNGPWGIAVNPRSGKIYVTDRGDDHVRVIDTKGYVGTLAGSDEGNADGTDVTNVQFDQPQGIVIDGFDNIYITDRNYSLVREILPGGSHNGYVITLAGNGLSNYINDSGKAAGFYFPDGIVLQPDGNALYVADHTNNTIRKVTIQGPVVSSTFAGSSVADNGTSGQADGTGTTARFNGPAGMAIDAAGNIYVADNANNEIRKITPAGVVTTVAGAFNTPNAGYKDGLGPFTYIYQPNGIAIDADGNLYVSDETGRIRKIVL